MKICTKRPILTNPDTTYSYLDSKSSSQEIKDAQKIINNFIKIENLGKPVARWTPTIPEDGIWSAKTEKAYNDRKSRVDAEIEKLKNLNKSQSKKYYFTIDYSTKHGVVKKGESLTGRFSSAAKEPRIMFDFYEKIDPAKAEAGEGIFSIKASDIKNFATDVAPEAPKEELSWWKKRSKMEKGLIIGVGVGALAVIFLSIRRTIIIK